MNMKTKRMNTRGMISVSNPKILLGDASKLFLKIFFTATLIHGALSKPLEVEEAQLSPAPYHHLIVKRSPRPLGVGYVSFGISSQEHRHAPLVHHPDSVIQIIPPRSSPPVHNALSSSLIKSSSLHRGPSIAHGSVINVAGHEIIQTHDKPNVINNSPHIILDYDRSGSHNPSKLGLIHSIPHAVSNSKKTAVTTKVEHVISPDAKKVIPILTHEIVHTDDAISHVVDNHVAVPTHLYEVNPVLISHTPDNAAPSGSGKYSFSTERNPYRIPYGGHGVGWNYGGHGGGHGYYSIGYF